MSLKRRKGQPELPPGQEIYYESCSHCHKRGYHTRKIAKAVQKRGVLQGLWKMSDVNVYPCSEGGRLWHVGHPPYWVRHGHTDTA